jgi:hypothetical protein
MSEENGEMRKPGLLQWIFSRSKNGAFSSDEQFLHLPSSELMMLTAFEPIMFELVNASPYQEADSPLHARSQTDVSKIAVPAHSEETRESRERTWLALNDMVKWVSSN